MSRSGYSWQRTGFTLVELLVVIAVIVILIAIFMPAVRLSPEASRRMQCGNNIKQISLGVQNYHDIFGWMPYGARNRTLGPDDEAPPTWGSSWLMATLPFCEQKPLFDKVVTADNAGSDYAGVGARTAAHNAKLKYLLCPSSPLPEMEDLSGLKLVMPSYAGIMGATSDSSNSQNTVSESRLVAAPYGGQAGSGGMLLLNESLTFEACTDGTANTIVIGEVSDYYYDDASTRRNPALAASGGWLAGTNLAGPIIRGGPAIPEDRIYNLITIAHPVGLNNRLGKKDQHPDWGTQGICPAGLNNPLLSAHPAGAMVGYLDGHVQMLTKQTAAFILKRLAIRDDGGELPEF